VAFKRKAAGGVSAPAWASAGGGENRRGGGIEENRKMAIAWRHQASVSASSSKMRKASISQQAWRRRSIGMKIGGGVCRRQAVGVAWQTALGGGWAGGASCIVKHRESGATRAGEHEQAS